MKSPIKKYQGIGLIEVLIATLVVGVGLSAVAFLQGNLMETSSANKVRAEAKSVCETKLEQLRDTVIIGAVDSTVAGEYRAIASSTADESITGTNEIIRRAWVVTNLTNPERKQISVTCRWDDAASPDADKQVMVQSIISYDSLGNAIRLSNTSSGGAILSPSTNAGSSNEIHDKTNVTVPAGTGGSSAGNGTTAGEYLKRNESSSNIAVASVVYKCTGETASGVVPFIPFDVDKGLYTRRVHYQSAGSFKEAIELAKLNTKVVNGVTVGDNLFGNDLNGNPQHSCTRKIRYNGGIMLPLKGTVYSKGAGHNLININLFTFDASESGIYCAFSPADGATVAPYVCYAGGNCKYGPVGTHKAIPNNTTTITTIGEDTTVFECPASPTSIVDTSTTPYPTGVYDTVGPGGWRGEVGLLGIPTSNAAHNNVCFAEEIAGTPETLNTARNYYARRGTGTAARNEGINKSYMCHDFLIIDGKNTASQVHAECVNQVGSLKLASKLINRYYSYNPDTIFTTQLNNVDLAIDKTYCTIISGTVTNGVTKVSATAVSPVGANGFFDCIVNTTANTYECDGTVNGVNTAANNQTPNYVTNVLVSEVVGGSHTCTASGITRTTANPITCNLAGATTTHTLPLIITASGVGTSEVTSVLGSGNAAFTCAYSSGVLSTGATYSCTVPDTWTGIITANSTCNGVAGNVATTGTIAASATAPSPIPSIILPSCAAPTTRNISVPVNVTGAGITNITGVTGTNVSCVLGAGTTYVCTVPVTWTGTLSAASTCNGIAVGDVSVNVTSASATVASINLASCAAVQYRLTVTPPTSSTGVINSTSPTTTDISCGSTCTHDYINGTTVVLSAVPSTGYRFSAWSGDCSTATTSTCTLSMLAAKNVSATFTQCTVPNITASTKVAAKTALTTAGFTLATTPTLVAGTAGQISAQSPAAGSLALCGSVVNYSYTNCGVTITGTKSTANVASVKMTYNGNVSSCSLSASNYSCNISDYTSGSVSIRGYKSNGSATGYTASATPSSCGGSVAATPNL